MNKDFAIVSALFNIEREGMDGRAWQDYLDWFGKTLQLKVPMILFVTEDLVEFIQEQRGDLSTHVVVQTTDEIPYYNLKDQLDKIEEKEDEILNKIDEAIDELEDSNED